MHQTDLASPKKGKLFLIVGPSGVGKGVLVKQLKIKHPEFFFPPSATTRKPRAGERDGEQYFFLAKEEFEKLEREAGFLETAIVHEAEKYGTLKESILRAINENKVVIREVDIQGLISIQEKLPREMFTAIFIAPPDLETLQARILRRQPNIDFSELRQRLTSAEKEMEQKDLVDYEIVSEEGQIDKMVEEFEIIIKKEIG